MSCSDNIDSPRDSVSWYQPPSVHQTCHGCSLVLIVAVMVVVLLSWLHVIAVMVVVLLSWLHILIADMVVLLLSWLYYCLIVF